MNSVINGLEHRRTVTGAAAPPSPPHRLVDGQPGMGGTTSCHTGAKPVEARVLHDGAGSRGGRVGAMAIGIAGGQEIELEVLLADPSSVVPSSDDLSATIIGIERLPNLAYSFPP